MKETVGYFIVFLALILGVESFVVHKAKNSSFQLYIVETISMSPKGAAKVLKKTGNKNSNEEVSMFTITGTESNKLHFLPSTKYHNSDDLTKYIQKQYQKYQIGKNRRKHEDFLDIIDSEDFKVDVVNIIEPFVKNEIITKSQKFKKVLPKIHNKEHYENGRYISSLCGAQHSTLFYLKSNQNHFKNSHLNHLKKIEMKFNV